MFIHFIHSDNVTHSTTTCWVLARRTGIVNVPQDCRNCLLFWQFNIYYVYIIVAALLRNNHIRYLYLTANNLEANGEYVCIVDETPSDNNVVFTAFGKIIVPEAIKFELSIMQYVLLFVIIINNGIIMIVHNETVFLTSHLKDKNCRHSFVLNKYQEFHFLLKYEDIIHWKKITIKIPGAIFTSRVRARHNAVILTNYNSNISGPSFSRHNSNIALRFNSQYFLKRMIEPLFSFIEMN